LEAEFSFDNIMAEVMAMKGDSSETPAPVAARATAADLELSFDAERSSSENEDGLDWSAPVPRKPLPAAPPPEEVPEMKEPKQLPPQPGIAAVVRTCVVFVF
jgi:hypothetical protein